MTSLLLGMTLRIAAAIAVPCALGIPLRLAAQAGPAAPVIVVLADSLPVSTAKAVLLFRAPPRRENVVLLPASSPDRIALGAALRLLEKLERDKGNSPHSAVIPIEGAVAPNVSSTESAMLSSVIDDVSRQPKSPVSWGGHGRWRSFPGSRFRRN